MALFALSDLHLSLGTDKPMDVFGPIWSDHVQKIYLNWTKKVSGDDLVIIGGDVSWATYLNEAKNDFDFVNKLPGRKLIIKGNHDYWWDSITKLNNFAQQNEYSSISFLHNSAYIYNEYSIAGTRGWILPSADAFGTEDKKIYERELIRLSLSLDMASKLEDKSKSYTRVAVLHFPPVSADGIVDDGIMSILSSHGVNKCIYGHLHGNGIKTAFTGSIHGIDFMLTSADYLGFDPMKIT